MDRDNDSEEKKILIVDDSETIRSVLKVFLKYEPYTIVEACNGVEAISRMEESSFDLVITDIIMPEMNGFKLIENIQERFEDTKVIAISGIGGKTTANSVLHGLYRMGVHDTLTKPFSQKELISLIEGVLL